MLRYLGKNTQVRLVIFDSRPGLQAHTSATDILDQAGVGSENVLQRDYFVDFCRHAILLFGGLMQRPGGTPSSFFVLMDSVMTRRLLSPVLILPWRETRE